MPQVHNKSHSLNMDSSAFNKNSRFMAALNFTEQSMHRVNVLNCLDERLCRVKLNYLERHGNINNRRIERVKNRLVDNLHKRLAYKLVLKNHSISNARDYKKALDGRYTYGALYHEVKDMVQYMKPEHVRERQAKALVQVNRKRYENLIRENRLALDTLCPPKKKWEPVDFSKFGKKDEDDEEEETKEDSKPLPPVEQRNRQSLAVLRRRVISLDDSKPNSPLKPVKSPFKSPSLSKPPSSNSLMGGKRQGITMNMMKKQRSFLSNKEKTGTLDAIELDSKHVLEATKEIESSRTQTTTRKSEDANNNAVTRTPEKTAQVNTDIVATKTLGNDKSKKSILPPIKTQRPGISANDLQSSPAMSPSKGLKLPVLKMNSNDSRKEIRVH